jgi:hypothetical protein
MEIVPPPNHCADRRPIFLIYGVRGKPLVKYYEFTSPIRGIEHISHRFVAGLNSQSSRSFDFSKSEISAPKSFFHCGLEYIKSQVHVLISEENDLHVGSQVCIDTS